MRLYEILCALSGAIARPDFPFWRRHYEH